MITRQDCLPLITTKAKHCSSFRGSGRADAPDPRRGSQGSIGLGVSQADGGRSRRETRARLASLDSHHLMSWRTLLFREVAESSDREMSRLDRAQVIGGPWGIVLPPRN